MTSKSSKSCSNEDSSPVRVATCTAAPSYLREHAIHKLGTRTMTVSVVPSLVVHHHTHVRVRHCKRIAAVAAAAAVVGVVAFAKWKTTCSVLLSFLPVVPCSHFFLPSVSSSASSAKRWVSPTPSLSRACSAALLAARQTRRRPRAVRMCGPLFTRIHHAFLHHVMCLFDTSFSSCIEFSFLASTHFSCVVTSFASWCPSWASTSLSSSCSS